VLAGLQVPPSENEAFEEYLDKLNYPYVEETTNPVFQRYLRAE
jgi:threonine dehydratase